MATLDKVRMAMHAQPFRPFILRLVDGTSYVVRHPDFIAIPPPSRGREVTFYADGDGSGAEEYSTHWIDLGLVSEVIVTGGYSDQPAAAKPEQ